MNVEQQKKKGILFFNFQKKMKNVHFGHSFYLKKSFAHCGTRYLSAYIDHLKIVSAIVIEESFNSNNHQNLFTSLKLMKS